MRRRLSRHPVQVRFHDDRPVTFHHGEREYEVVALLKMLACVRPLDDVDLWLWQVRAQPGDGPESTYELECDHGEWHLTATWEHAFH
ncbi:hypothetical protein DPM19_34070 [Actinomadura craniellae]|uniref:Uncharacterized protein n=1 Tax=Actinomadura craniellae TaxID=2231787 RepID=A0A365GV67_9ACTN|nr:hypothetical protein [Actinomadura craniellae]RAY10685.1 hypothetical protein DPM19_34070 [Actinomadura craniellae]